MANMGNACVCGCVCKDVLVYWYVRGSQPTKREALLSGSREDYAKIVVGVV